MQPEDSKNENYLTLWACPFEIFPFTPLALSLAQTNTNFSNKSHSLSPLFFKIGLSKLVSGESKQLQTVKKNANSQAGPTRCL